MPRPALAASRAIDILNFMAAAPARGYSLTDLVRALDLNPASCHALLNAMTRDGYLVRQPRGRTYQLGPALIAIGQGALQCHPLVAAARERIGPLSAELDLDCLLTARVDDRLIALASAGPGRQPGLRVGQRVPMIPPLGTPFLAWADEAEVESWLARAPAGVEPVRLRESLAVVRQHGFAVTLRSPQQGAAELAVLDLADEPFADARQRQAAEAIGRMGDAYLMIDALPDRLYPVDLISAPVFDGAGAVVCTLSLFGFDRPLSLKRITLLGNSLIRDCRMAANALTAKDAGMLNMVGMGDAECAL
ncbi:DNA-binding IclR family transcriptional regulator [Sphingobium sp. OAS761]|uniref:IclR family transcriptional regulator n=1 Tax=Sphingobium sp. OAS761 TaxID=2817901 RepID=UPI00209FA9E6|nr:helix-turn-helix domain-containing protein [Sphingobium sp. OAS761]MCP1470320.1 DNA-binding IclR family transcriptional regulator [Sphingobium sp. OAS761]